MNIYIYMYVYIYIHSRLENINENALDFTILYNVFATIFERASDEFEIRVILIIVGYLSDHFGINRSAKSIDYE